MTGGLPERSACFHADSKSYLRVGHMIEPRKSGQVWKNSSPTHPPCGQAASLSHA